MIRKQSMILILMLLFIMGLPGFTVSAEKPMPFFDSKEGVCLLDPTTGDFYYAQNENQTYYPASTTKLLTALTAMDIIGDHLSDPVIIGPEAAMISDISSKADIVEGEVYTWEQLLYGLLLPSGNDAAMTIAVNAARLDSGIMDMDASVAVAYFVELMNGKAAVVGASRSHFVNPHGLTDPEHYTTPSDMARIAMVSFSNPTIAKICQTPSYTYIDGNGTERKWSNSNILLYPTTEGFSSELLINLGLADEVSANPFYHPGVKSGKTGFTDEAGRCLVFSGEQGEMELMGVIFHSADLKTINTQAKGALDSALSEYTHYDLKSVKETRLRRPVIMGAPPYGYVLTVNTDEKTTITVPVDEKEVLTENVRWNPDLIHDYDHFLMVKKVFESGDQVGTLEVKGKDFSQNIPLYAEKTMEPLDRTDIYIIGGILILFLLLIVFIIVMIRRHKKSGNHFGDRI